MLKHVVLAIRLNNFSNHQYLSRFQFQFLRAQMEKEVVIGGQKVAWYICYPLHTFLSWKWRFKTLLLDWINQKRICLYEQFFQSCGGKPLYIFLFPPTLCQTISPGKLAQICKINYLGNIAKKIRVCCNARKLWATDVRILRLYLSHSAPFYHGV